MNKNELALRSHHFFWLSSALAIAVLGAGLTGCVSASATSRPDTNNMQVDTDQAIGAINRALDDFHDAAAKADEERYFDHFAPNAVFLGTDATERWPLGAFRVYSKPSFQRDSAWVYTPIERHVSIAPDGSTAWFDERLHNEKYGECRGSGVLSQVNGRWLIEQYNLTIPIPNDLAAEVVAKIRSLEAARR